MKIKYQFVTENVEIDVEEKWGTILLDLDRHEYNNQQKETRRHTTLDNRVDEGEWLSFDHDFDGLFALKEAAVRVRTAVDLLKPKQRDLIYALYLSENPLSQAEYAAKMGTAEESVKQSAWRARKVLKEILKKV